MGARGRVVLVTGGAGFVGANLVRRLLADGHEVHLLLRTRRPGWRLAEVAGDVRRHAVDLRDESSVTATVRRIRPEWVFHLAVYGAYPQQTDLNRMVQTNIAGTEALLRASMRVGCGAFINAGTSSEYGVKDHAPPESEVLDPNSYYAITKAASTMLCTYAARRERAHVVTLRLYSVYGPWENPGRLIPALVVEGFRGRLPPLVRPATARDFVFVDDAVDACLRAAVRPGPEPGAIYNVGTGIQTTVRQVVAQIRRIMAIRERPVWGSMAARHWDTDCWIADASKIRARLGWTPRHDLKSGLEKTVEWFRRTDLGPYVGARNRK